MTNQVIPAEAVEAAAKASFEHGGFLKWGNAPDALKERHRNLVQPILEAAAPHIRAQALEEAAAELDDKRLLSKAFHIFYPEWLRERAARMVTK